MLVVWRGEEGRVILQFFEDPSMSSAVHVHLRIVGHDGTVFTDCEILRLVKSHHQLEAVGLSIGESKSLQECLQQHIVTAQAAAFVDRHRCCPACGRQLSSKGKYPVVFRTVFGNVALSSPRFYRCGCQPADSKSFSPLTELFTEHTAPELLYLESRWASLISFGMTAALLKDVLPVGRHDQSRDYPLPLAQGRRPA